jgi:hypothetical protein
MRRKYTIDPVGRKVKFKFDSDSTKDFGGMVIDRKVTIDAINKPSRARKERPSFGGKPKKEVVAPPKPGGRGGMGNKEARANKVNRGPGGPGASMVKKTAKKRAPFVVDTFKG